jgi:hypothetical protein
MPVSFLNRRENKRDPEARRIAAGASSIISSETIVKQQELC